MPKISPQQQLRRDLAALAKKLPIGGRLEFDVEEDHVWLHVIYLPPEARGGLGSRLLSGFLECTDRARIPINMTADPTDEPGDPETFDLVCWYGRFGFELYALDQDQVALMGRPPQSPQRAEQILKNYKTTKPKMNKQEYEAWRDGQLQLQGGVGGAHNEQEQHERDGGRPRACVMKNR